MTERPRLTLNPDMIKLSGDGSFFTLQGEGESMGKPAVFMRLHFCNLKCSWCDTPYTWKKDDPRYWTESEDIGIKEAADLIRNQWGVKDDRIEKRVVFTGGEPLIQEDRILGVINELGEDWKVEIETNGTKAPSEELLARAQFNCSPKLENSGNSHRARVVPEAIKTLAKGNTWFKFVVMEEKDLDEIEKDYVEGCQIDPNRVILMPEGTDRENLQNHMQIVAEKAKEKGYRMMGRLQIDIWGAKRAV